MDQVEQKHMDQLSKNELVVQLVEYKAMLVASHRIASQLMDPIKAALTWPSMRVLLLLHQHALKLQNATQLVLHMGHLHQYYNLGYESLDKLAKIEL